MNMRRRNGNCPEYNVALLGELGVGKSALTVKYITRRFIMEYDPDIEDTYHKPDIIDGQEVLVWVMDTCDKPDSDPDRYLKWADAFLVVYSVTARCSYEKAREYLDSVNIFMKSHARDIPIALVGNKIDLERCRQVSHEEGLSLAADTDCMFFETSAAEDYDCVAEVFHSVIHELHKDGEFQSLFISEDKAGVQYLSPGAPGQLRPPRSPKPMMKEEKDAKGQPVRKAPQGFKFFNKFKRI